MLALGPPPPNGGGVWPSAAVLNADGVPPHLGDGSPPPPFLVVDDVDDLGTIGGNDAVATELSRLRLGNTGSMQGGRDSSGGLPPTMPEKLVDLLDIDDDGGNRGGTGGGEEDSRGGRAGGCIPLPPLAPIPVPRGLGGSGGGLPPPTCW